FWHHAAGLEISPATPIEMLPGEGQIKTAARRFEHTNALGNHFSPNTVAFDHRYFVVLQDPSLPQNFCKCPNYLLQKRRQSADVRYVFELAHHIDDLIRL